MLAESVGAADQRVPPDVYLNSTYSVKSTAFKDVSLLATKAVPPPTVATLGHRATLVAVVACEPCLPPCALTLLTPNAVHRLYEGGTGNTMDLLTILLTEGRKLGRRVYRRLKRDSPQKI